MQPIKFDSKFLERSAAVKSRIFTKEQALAEQVWLYFGKRIQFSRIMKMIKDKGHQFIYEVFNEVKNSRADDHLALFVHLVGKQTIEWKT